MFIIKKNIFKIILGFFYFISVFFAFNFYHHLEIKLASEVKQDSKKTLYTYSIFSNISKEVVLGIGVDNILDNLTINGKNYNLSAIKKKYKINKLDDYKQGYSFSISLNKGENTLEILGINTGGIAAAFLNYGISFVEYLLGFIFIGVPFIYILYRSFFYMLDREFSLKNIGYILPVFIIIIGVSLRIFVLNSVSNWEYQHDYNGHIKSIQYYAENPWSPPQPDKGLQYPQQPLYYLITGAMYNTGDLFYWNKTDKIYSIRAFSVFLSALSMIIGLFLIRLYTQRQLLINIFLSFLAFTPSFVLAGAFVNNDVLNTFLGILSIFGVSLFYKKTDSLSFFLASSAILLAMLTKISSILLTIFFAVVVIYIYKLKPYEKAKKIQKEALFFSLAVLFIFGWTLLKAYIPMSGEFRFVNSALYFNQIIPYLGLSYFFTFNWFDLIEHAQATVLYNDSIRFSLPTYLYGTMFLEDHVYIEKYLQGGLFKLSAQITYILGVIYLIGLLFYFLFFKKLETMSKLLIIPIVINLLLIIKFLNDYWVVCNSHFRYFSPVFSAIGLIFVLGLEQLFKKYAPSIKIIGFLSIPFYIAQIYWLVKLIKLT